MNKLRIKFRLEEIRDVVYRLEDELSDEYVKLETNRFETKQEKQACEERAVYLSRQINSAKVKYFPEMLLAGIKLRREDVAYLLKTGAIENKLYQMGRTEKQVLSAIQTLTNYSKGGTKSAGNEQNKNSSFDVVLKSGVFKRKQENKVLGSFQYTTHDEDVKNAKKRGERIKKVNRVIAGGVASLILLSAVMAGGSKLDRSIVEPETKIVDTSPGDSKPEGSSEVNTVEDDGTLFYDYSNFVANVSDNPVIQNNFEKMLKETRENPTYVGSSGNEYVYLDSNIIASANATSFVRWLFSSSQNAEYKKIGEILQNEFSLTAKASTNNVETSTQVGTGINHAGCFGLFQVGADAVVDANNLAKKVTGDWLFQTELARYSRNNKNANGEYLSDISQLNEEDLKRLDSPEFGAVVSLFVDACNCKYLQSAGITPSYDNLLATYLYGIGNMVEFKDHNELEKVRRLKYCQLQNGIDDILQERFAGLLSKNGLEEYKNINFTKPYTDRIYEKTTNKENGLEPAQKEKDAIGDGSYFNRRQQ